MADRFANRRVIVRGGTKRATQWVASTVETAVTSLGAQTALLDQSFAFLEPATIVRIRGNLWVAGDQTSVREEAFGAIGFAVVSNEALAIGVTAVPLPISDQESDLWMLWQPWFTGNVTSQVGNQWSQYPLESKAMRKVNDGNAIVVVIQSAQATFASEFLMEFRMLVKLHG